MIQLSLENNLKNVIQVQLPKRMQKVSLFFIEQDIEEQFLLQVLPKSFRIFKAVVVITELLGCQSFIAIMLVLAFSKVKFLPVGDYRCMTILTAE